MIAGIMLNSCISSYESEIDNEPDLISIEGSLIKGESEQTVLVSKTSSILYPRFNAVVGCNVTLLDELDNAYSYHETTMGNYTLDIPDEELVTGRNYMIRVITSEGEVYESDFEMLKPGIEVDSLYYAIEDGVDAITGYPYSGVQFYLDVKAPENESRYFRWTLEETFEYTSFGPISYYYMDITLTPVYPPDEWAVYQCWKGGPVTGLFQTSTMNLMENEKKKIPLNYVSNQTERLRIKYSLLVNQFSLSENAYNYFEENRIATEESDGLYTRQPRQPISNFQNINDQSERVLGFFWVSTKTSRRIFVPRVESMDVQPEACAYWEFDPMEDGEGPFPVYIFDDKSRGKKYVSYYTCFDCTKRGGSSIKPVFWE